jgi:sugar phosphate isomerase/epimerase
MSISVSDWADPGRAWLLSKRRGLGIESMAFFDPLNLDDPEPLVSHYTGAPFTRSLSSMHGPFADLHPASRDSYIRDATMRRFLAACGIARRLSLGDVVLHSGYVPKSHSTEEWLERSVPFWREVLDRTDAGVAIHVENVLEEDFASLAALIDAVASDRFDVCLDVGHAAIASKRPVEDWIAGLAARIRHVHLHNNDGTRDSHDDLGTGIIDMRRVLASLVEHAPEAHWIIECSAERQASALEWMEAEGRL